ncbi:MAG: hypothetical protein GVY26_10890 [Bacteroidetes bacterium]|nr:hypothetical protein [Bacteroidota bacterium]
MKRLATFGVAFVGFLIGLSCLTSCQNSGQQDIRDYYYPMRLLEDGLVYEYRSPTIDSLTPAYWYHRSLIQDDGVYLTSTYYEHKLEPLQLVKEEMVSNGMLIEDLFLYAPSDSTGLQDRIQVEVLQGAAFPFVVSDSSGVFLNKIRWSPPQDSGATYTIIKNRRYLGDTLVNVLGEEREAVVFQVDELLEHDKNGVFEKRYGGQEVYAKGIGLVYYNKTVDEQMSWDYALAGRYPMDSLEQQFKQQLNLE